MNLGFADVLDAARALSRAERAELAQELVATLESTSDDDENGNAELRAAVDKGVASLEAGRSTRLSVDQLGEYLRERGRLATERATAKRA